MDKNMLVKKLRAEESKDLYGYGEVVTDVYDKGENLVYPDETIVIPFKGSGINPTNYIGKCYTCCDNIDDFNDNTIWSIEAAREKSCNYFFNGIKKLYLIYKEPAFSGRKKK